MRLQTAVLDVVRSAVRLGRSAVVLACAAMIGACTCSGPPGPLPAPTPSPTVTPTAAPVPSPAPTTPVPASSTPMPTPAVPPQKPPSAPTTPPPQAPTSDLADLSNAQHGWGFVRRDDHRVPGVASWIVRLFSRYAAAYHASTSTRTVYLTMDEGYENGYTPKILDTLADKDVRAVFFCTGTYVRDNPGLVRRMLDEGHVVANHTWDHPNMVKKATRYSSYRAEITSVEAEYKKVTGLSLPRMLRMPSGNWSERCLAINARLGYRTYFWSFAYRDWETASQPDAEEALELILTNTHPGEIMLLHAVSKTNARILGDVIDGVRSQGYEFGLLGR